MLRQIPLHRQRGGGQRLQRRRHGLAPAGRAQCGREQRGHPRCLAYSSDFSQWVALVNNIPTLASRLNGLSIANVAASSHSYDLNRRRCAVRCAGSVSACHTIAGGGRSSRTRMSVQFSPSFRTCAPLAGPGAYCSRSVIFFSSFSFSLVLIDPCGRGGVREHLRERTRTDGTEPARHPPPEVVQVSVGRDGAVRPPWILRNRPLAALAGALTRSAAAYEVDARSLQPTVVTRPGGSISRGGSAPQ